MIRHAPHAGPCMCQGGCCRHLGSKRSPTSATSAPPLFQAAMKLALVLALLCTAGAQRQPQRPPKEVREEREEAQEGLVACRLQGKAPEECRKDFGNSTGAPPDPVKERFELETGPFLKTIVKCLLAISIEDYKNMILRGLPEQPRRRGLLAPSWVPWRTAPWM